MAKSNYDDAVFFLQYKSCDTQSVTSVTAYIMVDVDVQMLATLHFAARGGRTDKIA